MTEQQTPAARIYRCPQCRKPTQWREENAFRPFCSERCKLIDLGDWAAERHAIPADKHNSEDDEF